MSTRTRDRADRDAKLEALQQELGDAVVALVTGEDWKRALTFAAQFRSRSFNNTMLIHAQHHQAYTEGRVPEATPTYVAGFKQWLGLGRHVMKGQTGYGILAPVTARFASSTPANQDSWRRLARSERPRPGEAVRSRMVGLRPTHVWDVSQTAGDPLPELPRPTLLTGQAPAGMWEGLADQITAAGYELRLVSTASAIGGANGLTDFVGREVSVRMNMDDAAQVKTLAHELGHVLLHEPKSSSISATVAADAALHRGIAEVGAESIALMVGAAHGLDTSSYTVPQARDRWGDHAASAIWDASIVKVILGGSSASKDLQELSTLIGERDELTDTISVGDYGSRSLQRSTRRVTTMPPERIRTLPFGTSLVLLRSAPPIVTSLRRWTDR